MRHQTTVIRRAALKLSVQPNADKTHKHIQNLPLKYQNLKLLPLYECNE